MTNKPPDLPPVHSNNLFSSSASGHEFPSNVTTAQKARNMTAQPAYAYFQLMNQQMFEQHPDSGIPSIDSRHNMNLMNTSPPSDAKLSFHSSNNNVQCKIEHI